MAHVGIERFPAGECEEHGADHREGNHRARGHETNRLDRAERFEDLRRCPNIDGTEQPDHDEPGDHDRAEQPADARGAATLDHEQPDQDRERNRQGEVVELRRDELEALHRRQHGNGRRDDAVAIEQRRAQDAEQDQKWNLGPSAMRSDATSDNSARIPPSPSLSARKTNTMYLSDTIAISAQKISETIPRTSAAVGGAWPVAPKATEKV